ncbi:hypothetical protein G9C85_12925 [Halorubellus sp. JP-L1]|uniref:hypothetical protein n=1 Tax=Halorubellus sp. JP-L1 TaxID=2715753 RepID=UPI0014094827|nr:hypothetical protein [Halorubellus sp. JP-L1]NHN42523.1 hypothetical protein [Halorubellus sp. JP-L1]
MPRRPTLSLASDWRELSDEESVVFSLPTMRVRGHTIVYEDAALRASVRAATDGAVDQPVRFAFATHLAFDPPLPPGAAVAAVFPTIREAAERAFASDLRDRGFERVSRGRRDRTRTAEGVRVALRQFDATVPVDGARVDCEGWLGVWHADGDVSLAGGAYLTRGVGGVDVESGRYRRELLDAIRSVE